MVKHVNVFKAVVNYNNIVDPHNPHGSAMTVLQEMSLDIKD